MGEKIAVENGRISDFKGLVTLILTLDRVILHIFMHHSSTSTYIPNFIEITICGRTYGRTYGRADRHLRPTLLGRLGGVDLMTGFNARLKLLCESTSVVECFNICQSEFLFDEQIQWIWLMTKSDNDDVEVFRRRRHVQHKWNSGGFRPTPNKSRPFSVFVV